MNSISTPKERNRFFLCYFEGTRQCNLNCPYCMTRTSEKPKKNELSTSEIKSLIIDEVKKYCSHPAMAFSGGEFLLRKDAVDILAYTSGQGMWSFINTNATTLNKDKVREIKAATGNKVIFVFSLNSLESDVHEWSRDDSLNTVVKAARACRKERVNFFFILTISKNNLHTLEKTVKFLKSKGVPMLRSPFVTRGSGKNHANLLFSKEDMREIIHPVLREYPLSYVSYTPFFASPEFLAEEQERMNVSIGQLGCQAARGFVGINAEGDVAPCVQMLDSTVHCGNVKEKPLLDILQNNEILNSLRDRNELKGKCGKCRYKHTCGGCRAVAHYKTGDYLESDPNCFFEPETPETKSEHEQVQTRNTGKFLKFLSDKEPYKSLFIAGSRAQGSAEASSRRRLSARMKGFLKEAVGVLTGK